MNETQVQPAAALASPPATDVGFSRPESVCPRCNGDLIVDAVFCHRCGTRVQPDPLQPVKLFSAFVVAIFAVLLILAGLGALIQGGIFMGMVLISGGILCIRKISQELR